MRMSPLAACALVALAACEAQEPRAVSPDGTLYYTARQSGAATLTGGSGYQGSYLKKAEPAPAPAPAAAAKTPAGKLPLPDGYPLLPGDAELWPTLTLTQQQRALLFLKDGSTIRASMRTD